MRTLNKVLCLLFILHICVVNAEEASTEIDFWTFTFENDVFVGEDDGYTNGIKSLKDAFDHSSITG